MMIQQTKPKEFYTHKVTMVHNKDILNGYTKLPPIVEEMNDVMKLDSHHAREDATGHLLCWGCGEFGQHGHGYKKEVPFLDGAVEQFCKEEEDYVKHVSCGASHTAVVTNSNDLYVWGNGNSGQLGCNDLNTKMDPQKVSLYSKPSDANPNILGVACGGRHTMVWLENGQVFGFGNNLNSQLGYDCKQKNYKENQATPVLLKSLGNRLVDQVACGDKHTVFRFRDGGIACAGNNNHGQIGNGNREDASQPYDVTEFKDQPIKYAAAGSQHTLAVTAEGELYVWGYGRACGLQSGDLLSPVKMQTHKKNVVAAAGGSMHSMTLTGNGSVYTWGCGNDGQLGHGDNIKFLSSPRRVKDRHVVSKCVRIACGETFSAAVTEKGLLYMWGKNSHTIVPGKPTSFRLYLPYGVNKNFRGGRFTDVFCGSWHAVAIIGRPDLLPREDQQSSESESEMISGNEIYLSDDDELPECVDDVVHVNEDDEELLNKLSRQDSMRLGDREKTTVSLADFYAPTPDISKTYRSPSPDIVPPIGEGDRNIHTARSGATLIVQLPVQPMTTFADAATSPMTLTTTSHTSSTKSSSITTLSRVPSPIHIEFTHHRQLKTILKPEKKFKEFDPQKYERERLRTKTPAISEVVQFSKSPAGAFTLPHEPTGLSRKHVDFAEMEEIRLKGPKSPGRQFKSNKYRPPRTSSPMKVREPSPGQLRDGTQSKSRLRHMESVLSWKSDSALMESPLFKGSRQNVLSEYGRKPWDAPFIDDERQYKHHVPRNPPRQYTNTKSRSTDVNFGLQISRTKTIIAPLQTDGYDPADRISQLRRYAAMHNPQINTARTSGEKLKPIKVRHVSIPTGRAESPVDDIDNLCIGAPLATANKPSGSQTWRDRSDFDHPPPRKVAAGIVRMYISNNDFLGPMDTPLYSSLSDGRGLAGSLVDDDTLIVQPLLKKKLKLPDDTPTGLELPKLVNTQNKENLTKIKTSKIPTGLENDELELSLDDTPRNDSGLDSRVS